MVYLGLGKPLSACRGASMANEDTGKIESWDCPTKGCGARYKVAVTDIGCREPEHHECGYCGYVFVDGKSSKIYIPRCVQEGSGTVVVGTVKKFYV